MPMKDYKLYCVAGNVSVLVMHFDNFCLGYWDSGIIKNLCEL